MDTSYWKNKNYLIEFERTTKQFFGKYLYRLTLAVPGGRIIYENRSYELAKQSRQHLRKINPGGYWGREPTDVNSIDVTLLHGIRGIKDNNPGIKLRIEEPEAQFYAETEAELKAISDQLGANYHSALLSISGPDNDGVQQLLKTGAIIRKKEFGYRYKIILRDGRCGTETKQQILNYLTSLGVDEVKVSPGVTSMLSSKYNGFWNVWFYANDEAVTTFLQLLHPGCVLNIHLVVVV